MTSLIYQAKDIYAKYLEKEFGEPWGCSEKDIESLENEFKCSLPKAYQEYLLWMGKDANGVFQGSEWFYDCVMHNTALLPELLEENGVVWLSG